PTAASRAIRWTFRRACRLIHDSRSRYLTVRHSCGGPLSAEHPPWIRGGTPYGSPFADTVRHIAGGHGAPSRRAPGMSPCDAIDCPVPPGGAYALPARWRETPAVRRGPGTARG